MPHERRCPHPHGKQLTGGGRGISNGVGSGLDGAEDVLLCGAPGGNDGDVWEIIGKLKELGAQGILVTPIEKMIL